MKRIFLLFLLACARLSAQAPQNEPTLINSPSITLGSIHVTSSSTTIITGGTATLTAQAFDSMGQANIFLTNQCIWSSGNSSILTVNSAGIVTGVGTGSTTATCTDNGVAGSITITVAATPLISNPAAGSCGAPCILPQVTGGAAYTFTFAAVGGLLPYTWDCNGSCAAVFPSGLSLSSSGVLSGTTSTVGTTLWTVRVCDATPNCVTQAMSLTVVAAAGCASPGPPTYPCSSTATTNPGNISYLFSSTTSTGLVNTSGTAVTWVSGTVFNVGWNPATQPININGVAYTGYTVNSTTSITLLTSAGTHSGLAYFLCTGDCQNAVKEDTTIPGHVAGTDKITRIADEATMCGPAGRSVGNMTISSGDNDHMISIPELDGTYHLYVNGAGGGVCHFHISIAGGQVQVLNSNVVPLNIVNGGAFSVSSVNAKRFYYWAGSGVGSVLTQGDLTSDSTFTATTIIDMYGAGVCPGVPSTYGSTWHSLLNVDKIDDTFIFSLGPSGQGHSDWVFTWSRTKGCSTSNMNTGQAWAFCTSSCSTSTPPLVNPLTGVATFLGSVNTTTNSGVLSTGIHTINVASITNMFVGQALCIDTGNSTCTGSNQETITLSAVNSSGPTITANFTKTHPFAGLPLTYSSPACFGSQGASGAGIHDIDASVNGDYADIALQAGWTQGGCGGLGSSPGPSFWQAGTINDQWCSNLIDPGCGSHGSVGVTNAISPGRGGSSGPDLINLANMATRSIFFPTLTIQDMHCSWPHLAGGVFGETLPWVCGGDSATTGQPACVGGNGTSQVYCPVYLQNQIFLLFPGATYPPGQTKIVTHTGACGPSGSTFAQCNDKIADPFGPANTIGSSSPDGKFFCWVSSMWHQIGLDNNGKSRADAFCVMLQ